MAVFPESMNKLDVNDVPGSLGRLESYIRYMTERVEFAMRNMTRNVSEAGVSNVELLLLMQEMAGTVATLSNTVNGMTGSITSMGNRLDDMQTAQTQLGKQVTQLQTKQNEMSGQVTQLQTTQSQISGQITQLQNEQTAMSSAVGEIRETITDLDERVESIEGGAIGADIDCGSF